MRGRRAARHGVQGPAPSAAELADLRDRVGHRAIRVWAGREGWQIHAPRLEVSGIAFGHRDIVGLIVPPWSEGVHAAPAPSPIAWERVGLVEARHSTAAWGALAGAGPMASEEPGPGIAAAAVAWPVAGALGGALLCSYFPRWVTVWDRRGTAR